MRMPRREHDLSAAGLARRIEALRRVLERKDRYVQRFARTLARIKKNNASANAPRSIGVRPWRFRWQRRTTGRFAVSDAMAIANPLAERAAALWHEPG
jgi:hypothetical protein